MIAFLYIISEMNKYDDDRIEWYYEYIKSLETDILAYIYISNQLTYLQINREL